MTTNADLPAASAAVSHDEVEALATRVLEQNSPASTPVAAVLGAWFDAGLAWVHFPVGRGGLALDASFQPIANRVLEAAGIVHPFVVNPMGVGWAAPTILGHASEALKDALIRPVFTCEQMWCQLFSEPGAGSDLAGLASMAVRDGDDWVVTGQKVWTSLADKARWGLLLARTDPSVPKHSGLTYFVLDMSSPGVEVRPLRQLTGDAEFSEVHFNAVRIPDSNRLGEVGGGWRVAMTTLTNERQAIGGPSEKRNSGPVGVAVRLWHERPELRTPALEQRLVALGARADAFRLTGIRYHAEVGAGVRAQDGSASKLIWAELGQTIFEYCMDFLGPEATCYGGYEPREQTGERISMLAADDGGEPDIQRMFLRSKAFTIEGGTSDILRNIVGERILGLPGDLRVDRGIPWSEVRRG